MSAPGADSGRIAWLAADWGTSNLRLWAMDAGNRVVDQTSSADGMAFTEPAHFERQLLALSGRWLTADRTMPVYACGMVGARQGWIEAPYASVPCEPVAPERLVTAPSADARIVVNIVGGVQQVDPPDVMRGEETQIAGFLHGSPGFEGLIVLPGTHSKWVRVSGGNITGFQSWMTGELFALLSQRSVLRHSVQADAIDPQAFERHVASALTMRQPFAALFSVRAGDLLQRVPASENRALLSALLIAAEIRHVGSALNESEVVLIGAEQVVAPYQVALQLAGVQATVTQAEQMTRLGLTSLREQLTD